MAGKTALEVKVGALPFIGTEDIDECLILNGSKLGGN
jgi:hypothetical protein